MMATMKLLSVVVLALVLAGCTSGDDAGTAPSETPVLHESWLGMGPEDAVVYQGASEELLLIYVDETYTIGTVNASAYTLKVGEEYLTDYFWEDDDGVLWWYGRRGDWRADRRGEQPRRVDVSDGTAQFGDVTFVLDPLGPPTSVRTPSGVFDLRA